MSVVDVHERFHSRSGSEGESSVNIKRVFHVVVDDVNDDYTTIRDYGGSDLPKMWKELPNDSNYVVKGIEAKPMGGEGDQFDWEVTYSYSNRDNTDPSADETANDPTDLPPEIDFDFDVVDEVVENAYAKGADIGTGQGIRNSPSVPVLNSARDPFDPPVTEEDYRLIINIKRNEKPDDFDPNLAAEYQGTINIKQIMIAGVSIAEYEGLLRMYKGSVAWNASGNEYWVVNYQIVVNRKTWIKMILDRGYYTYVYGVTVRQRIKDDMNIDVTVPYLLDGGGGILAETNPATGLPAPVFLDYQTKWMMAWNNLDLPVDKSGTLKVEEVE